MEEWQESYYVNRTLCAVLEDMRLCCKTLNFTPMIGLIEDKKPGYLLKLSEGTVPVGITYIDRLKEKFPQWFQ